MTAAMKNKLQKKLTESRTRITQDQPFCAVLLMYFNYVADEKIKNVSMNEKYIFFNPNFLNKLYPSEVDFLLCHLALHVAFGHIWREQDLRTQTYHHACDIVVNTILESFGFNQKRFPHLGNVFKKRPEFSERRNFNADVIYYSLSYSLESLDERTNSRFFFDSDKHWDNLNFKGRKCNIILSAKDDSLGSEFIISGKNGEQSKEDDNKQGIPAAGSKDEKNATGQGDTTNETEDDMKQIWEGRVKSAKKIADLLKGSKGFGVGDLPGYSERTIGKKRKPITDWRRILESFVQEQINDYSFMPPDRRFSEADIFLPDFNEKEAVIKDVLFMIDTSGSFSDDMIATAFSEIEGALEQFNGKLIGKIGFFDTEIYSVKDFSDIADVRKIIPVGGGGTNFCPIFDYVYDQMNNDISSLIIITDGEAAFPENTSNIIYPVLWLINNDYITPPFGKTVRIPAYKSK